MTVLQMKPGMTGTTLAFDLNPENRTDEEKLAALASVQNAQLDTLVKSITDGDYMAAFSNDVGEDLTQIAGSDCKIIGTTPNTMTISPVYESLDAKRNKNSITPLGQEEKSVFEGDSGIRETKDIETPIRSGKYVRVSMSSMSFYSGGTMTIQGNSALTMMFQSAPIDIISTQTSISSKAIYMIGSSSIETFTKNYILKTCEAEISGNIDFLNNVQVGGSLHILGELYAPHLTTCSERHRTDGMLGGGGRINPDSVFCITTNLTQTALGAAGLATVPSPSTNKILGRISMPTIIDALNSLGVTIPNLIPVTIEIDTAQLFASLNSSLVVTPESPTGVSDIIDTAHEHFYIGPAFTPLTSPNSVATEGISACKNTEIKDGILQAKSSENKTVNYNFTEMVENYITQEVDKRISNVKDSITSFIKDKFLP